MAAEHVLSLHRESVPRAIALAQAGLSASAAVAAARAEGFKAGQQRARAEADALFGAKTKRDLIIAVAMFFERDPEFLTQAHVAILKASDVKQAAATVVSLVRGRKAALEAQAGELERGADYIERCVVALEDAKDWYRQEPRVGGVSDSVFHSVCDQNLMVLLRDPDEAALRALVAEAQVSPGVFLIQHDWASILDDAEVDEGDFRLPFDFCCFEFEASGRRVCAVVRCHDGVPADLLCIVRVRGGWGLIETARLPIAEENGALCQLAMRQVRAIAITLDAEVTRAHVQRAPHLSNAALKRGQSQPYDHHTLSLTRRHRAEPVALSGAPGHRKRLHFRRGHWRHYPSHKTWIRWCLVGDPSLGFADKDYRL